MRILICLFLTLCSAKAAEQILSFDSHIEVRRDGFLDVTETIKVNVEGVDIQRGIFRDFPQDYKTKWGLKEHRPFEVTGVTRNGSPEPYTVERLGSGTRVKIGSADFLIGLGIQEYKISYRTGRQLWFDEKGDELYWNVTGNFWNFPILQATARVVLPDGLSVQEAEAYTGAVGSTDRNYVKKDEANGVSFRTTSALEINEGLTIVVRWNPGALDKAAYAKPSIWNDNEALFIGMIVVVVGFWIFVLNWLLVGRDPSRGLIIPGWNPPEGFSPAAVRYLNIMAFDDKCFTAAVLSLAAKGYLTIEEEGSNNYKLIKQSGSEKLYEDERIFYQKLFEKGNILELKQKNHVQIGGAKNLLRMTLRDNIYGKYFHNHTGRWFVGLITCFLGLIVTTASSQVPAVLLCFMIFALVVLLLMVYQLSGLRAKSASIISFVVQMLVFTGISLIPLSVVWALGGIWCVCVLLAVMVVSQVFYHLMKAPTREGRAALDVIQGFREYLSVAEEERLNLENPPERTPELFERFLPYALALGVEQKWSEKFDDVLTAAGQAQHEQHYTPSFYSGRSGFENALIGAAIGAAVGSALASSSVSPSSSGSSSGGGGGGSSGGGGGGGGGGGW